MRGFEVHTHQPPALKSARHHDKLHGVRNLSWLKTVSLQHQPEAHKNWTSQNPCTALRCPSQTGTQGRAGGRPRRARRHGHPRRAGAHGRPAPKAGRHRRPAPTRGRQALEASGLAPGAGGQARDRHPRLAAAQGSSVVAHQPTPGDTREYARIGNFLTIAPRGDGGENGRSSGTSGPVLSRDDGAIFFTAAKSRFTIVKNPKQAQQRRCTREALTTPQLSTVLHKT